MHAHLHQGTYMGLHDRRHSLGSTSCLEHTGQYWSPAQVLSLPLSMASNWAIVRSVGWDIYCSTSHGTWAVPRSSCGMEASWMALFCPRFRTAASGWSSATWRNASSTVLKTSWEHSSPGWRHGQIKRDIYKVLCGNSANRDLVKQTRDCTGNDWSIEPDREFRLGILWQGVIKNEWHKCKAYYINV